jgi:peptidoglycan-associated lipoprotein
MEMKMNKVKLFALPLLAAAVVMTGCASRKPAAEVQTGGLDTTGTTTVNTQGLSEDAALNAQNMAGASAKGVTAENKAFLAKRVVHFDYDSTELSNEDLNTLQAHAQFLMANANSRVALTGHTDERGTREYNMALGERRGNGVNAAFSANGADTGRIEVVSSGEERPVCLDSDESCWSQNRRVEISYSVK